MAPVVKRFTISLAGSTSSIGTGLSLFFNFIKLRSVHRLLLCVVDEIGVFLKSLEAFLPHGLLQFADRQRIEQVIFAVDALMIGPSDGELSLGLRQRTERILVLQLRFARKYVEADAFQSRSGAREISIDQLFVQADGFEDLRALITLQSRDSHLGEGLQQTLY